MNERSARGLATLLPLLLISGIAIAARAEMIHYREHLSGSERHCLTQLLQSAWHFSSDFHREMMATALVARADLNGNGRKEYIYVFRDSASCGTAGCSMLIGQDDADGVCHVIYDYWGSEGAIIVLERRDHGYRRLYTPCEARFDGNEYRQVREECPNADVHR